ncbi:MAG: hypothetical protein DI586_07290 [Micavibrio aeruginosavorus]|uniref:carbonic anhydrase n=1 Tax=Micavibrio aeruginosavorus TaxID=349221 RepID=A0A2W5FH27_9BACT|nr:MAG: hypothetical protein DI586_07290 [Micavibrio aeruginosavorus]
MVHPLLNGFQKFRAAYYKSDSGLMLELVEKGQSPDYFVISCIDSRSDPGTIFQPEPGTFFAHKAMGAIVRPYKKGTALSAALQFALEHNNVREIIVLGHTGCGAIKALVEKIDDEEISSFVDVAKSGLEKAKRNCDAISCSHNELLRHTEEQIVLESVKNLETYPSVQKALKGKNILVKAWLFDMLSGQLLEFSTEENNFIALME